MKTMLFLSVLCLWIPLTVIADPTADYIKANAIQTPGLDYPPEVFSLVENTKLILFGEMHGTQESPAAVFKMVRLLSVKYSSILLALEIPQDAQPGIDSFLTTGDFSILKAMPFFTDSFQDGRRSQAMANLLNQLRGIGNVHVICIDPVHQSPGGAPVQDRDLGMAQNIAAAIASVHPSITVSLTGNCHSKLLATTTCNPPSPPMGADLLKIMSDLNLGNVLSLDVRYESGTAWTAMSDFIGVHSFGPVATVYTQAVPWDSYILKESATTSDGYSGAWFVRRLSYSLPLVSPYPKVDADIVGYDQKVAKMESDFNQIPVNPNSVEWVKAKVSHMVDVDQFMRLFFLNTPTNNGYTLEEKNYFYTVFGNRFSDIDKRDTADLKSLLKIYEWFKISQFGADADHNAWLLVQHADLDRPFQKAVLAILTQLWPIRETSPANYAYLFDRVAASPLDPSLRKPQLYGTQGTCKGPGDWEPDEIQAPDQLDQRRSEMGLIPFADYKKKVSQFCH